MKQNYAFTTTAMAAALEATPISYEDLAEIEQDFDDVETELSKCLAEAIPDTFVPFSHCKIRHLLTYEKNSKNTSQTDGTSLP